MKLFEFTPKKNANKLAAITGILIIGAVLLLCITVILGELAYRWILQLAGIIMLTAGVFITSRYVMKSYVYSIIEVDGGNDLTVTEIQCRHTITVCRISISGIEQIYVVDKKDREAYGEVKKKAKAGARKRFNYCADFLEQKYICILCTECGESLAIELSWDESLERLLA